MISLLQFITVAGPNEKRGLYRKGSLCITNSQMTNLRYRSTSAEMHVFDADITGIWVRHGYEQRYRTESKHVQAHIVIPQYLRTSPLVGKKIINKPDKGITIPTEDWSPAAGRAMSFMLSTTTPVSSSDSTTYYVDSFIKLKKKETDVENVEEKTPEELIRINLHRTTQKISDQFGKNKNLVLFPISNYTAFHTTPELYTAYIWSMLTSPEWFLLINLSEPKRRVFSAKIQELRGIDPVIIANLKFFREFLSFTEVLELPTEYYQSIETIYYTILGTSSVFERIIGNFVGQLPANNASLFCGNSWHLSAKVNNDLAKHLYGISNGSVNSCRKNGFVLGEFINNNA